MKKYQKRTISLLTIFLLLFPMISPAFAGGSGNEVQQVLKNKLTSTDSKISERLLEAFGEQETTTFLVKFKERADTTSVVKDIKKQARKNNLSSYKAKFLQRSAVVSELRTTAEQEQANVLAYLEQEEANGNAKNIESFFIVNAVAVTATEEVAKKIASFDEVEKILPNETRQLIIPEEVESNLESSITDENIEWNVDRVKAPEAWEKGIDGEGVVIAVIDSGAQWDHPSLKEKYRGYNVETGEVDHDFNWFDVTSSSSEPFDDLGHGTHVTGTILGGEPSGANQIGVAPGAEWMAVKAFTDDGEAYDTEIIAAGEWILAPTDSEGNTRLDMAPDIVNNSWSGGAGLEEWFRDVVIEWRNAEIFPVFAAGNIDFNNSGGPGSIAIPANYPESFAVGATDKDNLLAEFSLQGPSPYGEIKPDISAPGVPIRSAIPGDIYATSEGTSMAAPAVTGVAALLLQAKSNLELDELEELLIGSAVPLTDDGFTDSPNNGYGHGLVNAEEALSIIIEGQGTLEGTITNSETNEPVRGKVGVVESGRSATTSLENGSYKLLHKAGEYTAVAEAYGYISEEQSVVIEKDQTTTADFSLKELPKGTVSGVIRNKNTGNVIDDAKVFLVEDANIKPVETDENGRYSLTAYHETYTLRIVAWNFITQDIEVTISDESVEINVDLDPYYTYPGEEIGYDDGTAENSVAYYGASLNGYGVKMTLPEGKDSAIVTDGVFMFDEVHVDPDATEFLVEVWDANGENGTPGEKIAGPFEGEAIREENVWSVVDLREHHIEVDQDFYMVYIQKGTYSVPGLAIDQDGRNAGRSYEYILGAGWRSVTILGNYMIRARVAYDLFDPMITSPDEELITNQEVVLIEGTSPPTTTVELRNNDEVLGEAEVGDDGLFTLEAQLTEGKNELTALSKMRQDITGTSDPITVTLDRLKPELSVTEPRQGDVFNKEVVTVAGSATDNVELDWVKVNDQQVSVESDTFSEQIILEEGTNNIEVVAKDKAGNIEKETITVEVVTESPEINDLQPNANQHVIPGQKVEVSFTSPVENGEATFKVIMPNLNGVNSSTKNKMNEVEPGVYKGEWVVPEKLNIEDAVIEVQFTDPVGNTAVEQAGGKISVYVGEQIERISGKSRYETAVETSKTGWSKSDKVVLARGDDFADALAGVPLAYALDAPILLTRSNQLPEVTKEEIDRLGASEVYVLGGTQAVGDDVIQELTKNNMTVERISGKTRFETAVEIAKTLAPENAEQVVVANGLDFPDALSVASQAAVKGLPILLTKSDVLPEVTKNELTRLQAEETIVVGGTEVVSDMVMKKLPSAVRLRGSDRYGTNIAIQEHFNVDQKHMYVAAGNDYADALTGAVLAAKNNSSILLVRNNDVPDVISTFITEQQLKRLSVLGGTIAVSEDVYNDLKKMMK